MSENDQPVDLLSLLDSIQTLTNQVNALQKPAPVVKPLTKKSGNRTIPHVYGQLSLTDAQRNNLYDISRNALVEVDASLCFAVVANSPYLSESQRMMINADTSFNIRYSKMEMYPQWTTKITNGFGGMDSSFNMEVAVAKKFNALVKEYIKEFKPVFPLSDVSSQILNKKFPTHNYFPEMKGIYESSEIFKVLDSFPKGGQLHVHSGALCDIDWVLMDGKYSNPKDVISSTSKIGLTYDLSGGDMVFL